MPDSLPPNLRNIGRYALLRELRRDRASVSYFAMDPVLHREAIVKAVHLPLPSETAPGSGAQISSLEQAFVRQAQAAGKLHHPHIVTVFEAGRMKHIGYMAIERVPGRRLHELIASGWRPPFAQAASIAARVADALEYAHLQGVAHGHLGPQHVILQESDGAPKVEGFGGWVDGGLAGHDALERTERLLPYFDDIPEETRRRDVRAVASLLYMMLTGRAPDATGQAGALVPIKSLRLDTPDSLALLVDSVLTPEGANAHRTAGDVRDALTAFIWNERGQATAPVTLGIPLAPPPPAAAVPELSANGEKYESALPGQAAQPTRTSAATPASIGTPAPRPHALPPTLDTATPAQDDRLPELMSAAKQQTSRWLNSQRMPLVLAAALLATGVAIGVLITTLAQRPGDTSLVVPTQITPDPQRAGVGMVALDITPWGEVFVNNRAVGVAPPLKELQLPAGRHAIEIRGSEGKAVTANVDVDPARPSKIRHAFK